MNEKTLDTYELPTSSLPGLDISFYIADLKELIAIIEQRGIKTANTRLSRYLEYLQKKSISTHFNEYSVFKNSTDGPFQSKGDWSLYVLREVHELMWILKGIKKHVPERLDEKLKLIVSGRDFSTLDSNSISRDTQFELRIASYYCQTGCGVDLSKTTDIIAHTNNFAFYTECKRIGSFRQLRGRLSQANKQLSKSVPRKLSRKIVVGCIAADVTKIAFPHDGLTFGVTNEHSRNVIQNKLLDIGGTIQGQKLFERNKKLDQIWLQIHIPSQIMYPPTNVTRFSSYFLFRTGTNRKQKKVVKTFKRLFDTCSTGDERGYPPQTLKQRRSLDIPEGSSIRMDEELLDYYLSTGELPDRDNHDLIAEFEIYGKKEEFRFWELQMLASNTDDKEREAISNGKQKPTFNLVFELYIQRYPYDEY